MDERNLINGSLVSYLSWAADFISPIREINSCFNNYFEARGSKLRINIFKWLKNKSDIMVPSDDENDTTKT